MRLLIWGRISPKCAPFRERLKKTYLRVMISNGTQREDLALVDAGCLCRGRRKLHSVVLVIGRKVKCIALRFQVLIAITCIIALGSCTKQLTMYMGNFSVHKKLNLIILLDDKEVVNDTLPKVTVSESIGREVQLPDQKITENSVKVTVRLPELGMISEKRLKLENGDAIVARIGSVPEMLPIDSLRKLEGVPNASPVKWKTEILIYRMSDAFLAD